MQHISKQGLGPALPRESTSNRHAKPLNVDQGSSAQGGSTGAFATPLAVVGVRSAVSEPLSAGSPVDGSDRPAPAVARSSGSESSASMKSSRNLRRPSISTASSSPDRWRDRRVLLNTDVPARPTASSTTAAYGSSFARYVRTVHNQSSGACVWSKCNRTHPAQITVYLPVFWQMYPSRMSVGGSSNTPCLLHRRSGPSSRFFRSLSPHRKLPAYLNLSISDTITGPFAWNRCVDSNTFCTSDNQSSTVDCMLPVLSPKYNRTPQSVTVTPSPG